jgi:hypothetical protein
VASRFGPAEYLILVDAEMIALAGGTANVRASKAASIEMTSSPTMSARANVASPGISPQDFEPVPAETVSMFQSNSTAMICEIAANWHAQPNAVAAMDVASWSGGSP